MINSEIQKTEQEVIPQLRRALQEKVAYSISLLRRAEKLAMAYDPQDGFYLAFSGGKDSQALYHVAKLAGVRFKAHMNFTSVDPPEVIRFVRRQYPDVHTIPPKDSIYNIAVKRGILPTRRVRWCCQEFKERAGAGKVTLIGIRRQESIRRAKRNEVEIDSRKFSGTLEQLDEYREKKLAKEAKQKAKKPQGVNITNATEERTVGCISGKESLLVSPILYWTEDDVWNFLGAVGATHCTLYDEGWHRIGCINCPMGSAKQHYRENVRYPHVKRNWIKAIMAIRAGGVSERKPTSLPQEAHLRSMGRTDCQGKKNPEISALWGASFTTKLGFSAVASSDGDDEAREREIAEMIYDWWVSGKSYKKWYAEKFQQLHIDFSA